MLPSGLPDSLGDILFDHQGNTFQLPVIILAAISAAVLMVSFLGCVGSCQQSRCLVSMVSGRDVIIDLSYPAFSVLSVPEQLPSNVGCWDCVLFLGRSSEADW
jgi:hypothetical protein